MGTYACRRYLKKPLIPIPAGRDRKKWKRIATRVTDWLQQILRTDSGIRQDLRRAQQAEKNMHHRLDAIALGLGRYSQKVEHLESIKKKNEEKNNELHQDLLKKQAEIEGLRQELQSARRTVKKQEQLIRAGKKLEDDQRAELEEQAKELQTLVYRKRLRREKAELSLKRLQSPKAASGRRELARFKSLYPDQSSTDDNQNITTPRVASTTVVCTPPSWIPLADLFAISTGSNTTRQQSILQQDPEVRAITTQELAQNQNSREIATVKLRKRRREAGTDGEEKKPAKIQRSSPPETEDEASYTPEGLPRRLLFFESQNGPKRPLNPLLWGSDGEVVIKFERPDAPGCVMSGTTRRR